MKYRNVAGSQEEREPGSRKPYKISAFHLGSSLCMCLCFFLQISILFTSAGQLKASSTNDGIVYVSHQDQTISDPCINMTGKRGPHHNWIAYMTYLEKEKKNDSINLYSNFPGKKTDIQPTYLLLCLIQQTVANEEAFHCKNLLLGSSPMQAEGQQDKLF